MGENKEKEGKKVVRRTRVHTVCSIPVYDDVPAIKKQQSTEMIFKTHEELGNVIISIGEETYIAEINVVQEALNKCR